MPTPDIAALRRQLAALAPEIARLPAEPARSTEVSAALSAIGRNVTAACEVAFVRLVAEPAAA